jgi:hypothetical protein
MPFLPREIEREKLLLLSLPPAEDAGYIIGT